MQRLIWWALGLLLAGAAINVAVAMLIAACIPIQLESKPTQGSVVLASGERAPYILWRQRGNDLLKWHWLMIQSEQDALEFPIAAAPAWSDVARRQAYNPPGAPFFVNVRVELAS